MNIPLFFILRSLVNSPEIKMHLTNFSWSYLWSPACNYDKTCIFGYVE